MLAKFFAQDNATAKLASTLVFLAGFLSFMTANLHLSPTLATTLLILSGVFTVVAQFFQANPAVKNSAWWLLAYMVLEYLANNTSLADLVPNANTLLLTLAALVKTWASFTTQKQDPLR